MLKTRSKYLIGNHLFTQKKPVFALFVIIIATSAGKLYAQKYNLRNTINLNDKRVYTTDSVFILNYPRSTVEVTDIPVQDQSRFQNKEFPVTDEIMQMQDIDSARVNFRDHTASIADRCHDLVVNYVDLDKSIVVYTVADTISITKKDSLELKDRQIWVTGWLSDLLLFPSNAPPVRGINLIGFKAKFFDAQLSSNSILIKNSRIDTLDLSGANFFKKFKIENSSIKSLDLHHCQLPDTIYLTNLDLSDCQGVVDFRQIDFNNRYKTLILSNTDLIKLAIPFDRINIVVSNSQTYEQAAILYQQLLKALRDAGLTEKYEFQDKKFQELRLLHDHHWFLNWLSKSWWDYGYSKDRIFLISLALFVFFFMCNTIFLNQLQKVYVPKTFVLNKAGSSKFARFLYQLPGTFLYTAFIFWGLKLELKEIKIGSWTGIILIITQYILGVICLAYLANYVLSR